MADAVVKTLVQVLAPHTQQNDYVVYDMQAPPTARAPYIVVRRMSTDDTIHLRGVVGEARTTVDIACIGRSVDECAGIANYVRGLLHGKLYNGQDGLSVYSSSMTNDSGTYDPPADGRGLGLYARIQTFAVWHSVAT